MQQGNRPGRSSQGIHTRPETRAFDPRAERPQWNTEPQRETILRGAAKERSFPDSDTLPTMALSGTEITAMTVRSRADDRVLASVLVFGTLAAMIAIVTAAAPSLDFTGLFQGVRASQAAPSDIATREGNLKPISLSAGILESAPPAQTASQPARATEAHVFPEPAPAQAQAEKPRVRRWSKRAVTRGVRMKRGVE